MARIGSRRRQALAATAMAAVLLLGTAACGGSSDGGSNGTKTTQASGSSSGSGSSGDAAASKALPDPCTLVPIEKASEILGGEAAQPASTTSDVGTASRACTWKLQSSIDDPTLDGAGHILTLTAIAPVGDLSMDEFFGAAEKVATEKVDVDGCDKAYWMGGLLSALQHGVYLTGSAGLAATSPDARESTTELVAAACAGVS